MQGTVSIAGSSFVEGRAIRDESLESMIFRAATGALEAAGLRRDDLDGIVLSASDQTDGRAISSMLTSGPAGAYLSDEINIASSPGHALALAAMQIESGVMDHVLLASWGKASETPAGRLEDAERLSAEPYFERAGGITALGALGMQAGAYRAARDGASQAARAVALRSRAAADPGFDAAAVEDSPLVAEPLCAVEIGDPIDGVYVLVLRRGGDGDDAVALRGMGWSSEAYRLSDRDLVGAPHLRAAAARALAEAGVDDPGEIDLWELHDPSADALLVAYEAVGLAEPGQGPRRALDDGGPRVNPWGGALGGEAPFGGPLRKVVRAATAMRSGDVDTAFVQISSGYAGQFQSAFVLGRHGA